MTWLDSRLLFVTVLTLALTVWAVLTAQAQQPAAKAKPKNSAEVSASVSDAAAPAPVAKVTRPDPVTPPSAVAVAEPRHVSRSGLVTSLTIFVLAIFVGFEVIAKVPPTLHTPLMSGSNAISGITLVGAIIVAGLGFHFASFIGFLAVILATINVVGGCAVTHRMLAMFKTK